MFARVRAENKWPLREVAARAGVSINAIYGWENGMEPGIANFIRWAAACGYRVELVPVGETDAVGE